MNTTETVCLEPTPLLRPQALAGEGCIEWFRATERRPRVPVALMVLGSIASAGLMIAVAMGIEHNRTITVEARIEIPTCPGAGAPCLSRMTPVSRDAHLVAALTVGNRLDVSFADGTRHTLIVASVVGVGPPALQVAWPRRSAGRSGLARVESTQSGSLLAWLGWSVR